MPNHATNQQILAAYDAMTSKELALLLRRASRFARVAGFDEPIELVHEVMARALERRRKWPLHVKFGAFLYMTMRGIAHDVRELRENKWRAGVELEEVLDQGALRGQSAPSTERVLLDAEAGRMVMWAAVQARQKLEGDFEAQRVLDGMLADMEPREICESMQIDPERFEGARKRAVRKMRSIVLPTLH